MSGYQQFFAEMKRRRVFRVMAVYGVIGFGVIEAAGEIFPRVGIPDWAVTLVVWLALLGFPIAVVLAWAFESSPEGMKRTEDASPEELGALIAAPASQRLPAGLMALAGMIALLLGAYWAGRQTALDPGIAEARSTMVGGLRLADLSDDPRPSIAVLPFADMSSTQDQEYFGDGMSEAILNVFTQLGEMRVAGRTSAFAYKGDNRDLREIGSELGVNYLVEGSIAKEGDQVRITAQLISAADGSHLWSETYARPWANIFDIQSEISAEIAEALKVPLGLDGAADLVSPTDLDAYDLYLAGRARLRERGESLPEAIRLFEAVIARDSTWARGWAGLAEALEVQIWYGDDAGQAEFAAPLLERAEAAARKALELDPSSASAYVALGSVLRDRYDWQAADSAYLQALTLDPDNAEAHQQRAELFLWIGRNRDAVLSAARATELDPAPVRFTLLGWALSSDDRSEEAILAYERGILLDPDMNVVHLRRNLAGLHYEAQRYEEALEILSILPDASEGIDPLWYEFVELMRRGEFDLFPDSLTPFLSSGQLILLGESDRAADLLANPPRRSIHSPSQVWRPIHDSIRDHSAVQQYLEDVGLGGVTVQRTPLEERVRPAILRRADETAAAQ